MILLQFMKVVIMARKSERPSFVLTQEQRCTLQELSASRVASTREVERAKVMLGYADGISITELQRRLRLSRKLSLNSADSALTLPSLNTWLDLAERVSIQQSSEKNKLHALHVLEAECIGKNRARKPLEFGVMCAIVASHQHGLMFDSRTFPANTYYDPILSAVLREANTLTQDLACLTNQIVVNLSFWGVYAVNPYKLLSHRGKYESLSEQERSCSPTDAKQLSQQRGL